MLNDTIYYLVKKESANSVESVSEYKPSFLYYSQNTYKTLASVIPKKIQHIRNEELKESLFVFGTEHRLEFVTELNGIRFINDSKSTNINATWFALESMTTDVVLILGGVERDNDYNDLVPLVKTKVTAIICLGTNHSKITEAFKDIGIEILYAISMLDATLMAYQLAQKHGTVLLSPACASFDWFKNYEDRGNQFKQAIKELS